MACQMGCKILNRTTSNPSSFPPRLKPKIHEAVYSSACIHQSNKQEEPLTTLTQTPTIKFQTFQSCKLGIARYPDFEYNADGGVGSGMVVRKTEDDDEMSVSFDVETLYIPPLTGQTTRFLGLPLPPFLKIEIAPEVFEGTISKESGKVELRFGAKFWFSVASIYRAPPLVVETTLTSEESKGAIRSGKGERMDGSGRCRLAGVATVDPIDDILMDSFLGLPTECIAVLNARISL